MGKTALEYFREISAIPRPSGHMEGIRAYVNAFAEERGLEYLEDSVGNITIRRPASAGYEKTACLMLQGHMDMIAAKVSTSYHDFETEPLTLITDGDILKADGTTLGADDGVAVAYMLAILDDPALKAPELECVFTVDEETGLEGANAMDCSALRSKYMINLDSPAEGVFTVSCAGGKRYDITYTFQPVKRRGLVFSITLSGLKGGHSGEDAHRGRASANVLMGEILKRIDSSGSLCLSSFTGGSMDNAIPSYCTAEIQLTMDNIRTRHSMAGIERELEEIAEEFKARYRGTDPDLELSVSIRPEVHDYMCSEEDTKKIIALINGLPSGIISMSDEIGGLVQSSSNLGIVDIYPGKAQIVAHMRSSEPAEMDAMSAQVEACAKAAGAAWNIPSEYPGWAFQKESRFRDLATEVYRGMYGSEPELEIIHAGLECGILKGKMPDLDIISTGPNVWDLHSPDERLSLSSFERVYDYVVLLLSKMDDDCGL